MCSPAIVANQSRDALLLAMVDECFLSYQSHPDRLNQPYQTRSSHQQGVPPSEPLLFMKIPEDQ